MLLIKSAHKRLVQMNEMSEYKKCQTRRMTGRGMEHGAWNVATVWLSFQLKRRGSVGRRNLAG